MNEKKYLPIGSVVLLDGGEKKLMVTGYCVRTSENPNKIYDYSGCFYPEGIIRSNESAIFDHHQIKEIFFTGYYNDEASTLIARLREVDAEKASESV